MPAGGGGAVGCMFQQDELVWIELTLEAPGAVRSCASAGIANGGCPPAPSALTLHATCKQDAWFAVQAMPLQGA